MFPQKAEWRDTYNTCVENNDAPSKDSDEFENNIQHIDTG